MAVSATPSALRDEALALPAEQRAELVVELLASLDDDMSDADPDEIDRAWGEEMQRRSAQIASGEVKTLTWDEVLDQVAASRRSRGMRQTLTPGRAQAPATRLEAAHSTGRNTVEPPDHRASAV